MGIAGLIMRKNFDGTSGEAVPPSISYQGADAAGNGMQQRRDAK